MCAHGPDARRHTKRPITHLSIHRITVSIHYMDDSRVRKPAPPLLPVFRSRQQAELLAYLLAEPARSTSLTELSQRLQIPFSTVHREIGRAEKAGIVHSTKSGRARTVAANTRSPYFEGLADVLVKAFGPPQVVAEELVDVPGVAEVFLFGSWPARFNGLPGDRPVADIDVLVLGDPDRDALYTAAARAERRLGREVQITIREMGWIENGEGSFHQTVISRPTVRVLPQRGGSVEDVQSAGLDQ